MQRRQLILGLYGHFPEGLDDPRFEERYQSTYRPFLSVLNRFPDIRVTIAFSGSLFRRLEALHPEYLMLIEEMVSRRQCEVLGGGFYAPFLPLIPGADRLGQVELLTTYLRKKFGKRPRGCWLHEYTWEPQLASMLQACGMDYTFLPFDRIDGAGIADTYAPLITEDQGKCVVIFPVKDGLASGGSIQPIESFIEDAFSSSSASGLVSLMIRADSINDLWRHSGYETPDAYFEHAFVAIRKHALEAETTTASRYLKGTRSYRRAYVPGCSSELLANSVSDDLRIADSSSSEKRSARECIIAGERSAAIYSRMQYVYLLIGSLRGDKSRKKTASEDLWKAQSADAYWRSPSGGVNVRAIRRFAFRSLIEAEQTTRHKGTFVAGVIQADIDFDGRKEYLYQGTDFNCFIHSCGASTFEIDYLKNKVNILDLYSAPKPRQHHVPRCFVDRIYAGQPTIDDAIHPDRRDIGSFADGWFDPASETRGGASAAFQRDGFFLDGESRTAIRLRKDYEFSRGTIKLSYELSNKGSSDVSFTWGTEFNFSCEAQGSGVEFDGIPHAEPPDGRDAAYATGLRAVALKLGNGSPTVELSGTDPFDAIVTRLPGREGNAPIPESEDGFRVLLLRKSEIAPGSARTEAITLGLRNGKGLQN